MSTSRLGLYYFLAIAAVAAATLARIALNDMLEDKFPFVTFFIALALIAWLTQTGPAIVCALLGAAATKYFFIPHRFSLWISEPQGAMAMVLFLAVCGVIVSMSDTMRRARADVEKLLTTALAERERTAQSEAQFRQLADALPQIVWVTRPDGHHEYYNRRWYDYVGGTPEDSLGDGWNAPLHPEDRPRAIERWARSLRTGEDYEIEYRFRSKEGEYRWFLGRALPVRGPDGAIVRWFGTCTDIDDFKRALQERQEAQAALERNEAELARLLADERRRGALLRQLADASLAVNSATSLEGVLRVVTAEARRTVGAEQGRAALVLDGRTLRAASPEGAAGTAAFDRLVLEGNRTVRLTRAEAQAHPLAGPSPPPGWLAAPLTDRAGRNVGLIALSDRVEGDFTADDANVLWQLAAMASVALENARLYDALRESDRRKDEFLATLAHELRNPLAPVRTGLQILRLSEERAAREQAREMMERQVAHFVRLIDDLLTLSRVNKGKIQLVRTPTDLAALFARAVEAVRPALDAVHQSLRVDLPAEPVELEADVDRLTQALVNLLSNASKYTPDGGRITLSGRRVGPDVVIQVSDEGVGIAADMLERVFDMFAQEKASEGRAQGGLGIGLTLVRGLVGLHGGSVHAASPGRDRGSTFTIRLRAEDGGRRTEESQGKEEGSSFRPPSSELRPPMSSDLRPSRRVLVVDDNVDSARSLDMLLRLWGHEVRMAHDGPGGVRAAEEYRPDTVLLDIGLPGMSGWEVARRLREMPGVREGLIVAMTGYGQDEDRRRSAEAGFDEHLVKPLDPDALKRLLERPRPG